MRLTEASVQEAFAASLRREGWEVSTSNADFIDLLATRGDEVLVAEIKGHTKSAGAALDIGYGQLLRRIDFDRGKRRYALVVPASLRRQVERARPDVRARLEIEVHVVDEHGAVTQL